MCLMARAIFLCRNLLLVYSLCLATFFSSLFEIWKFIVFYILLFKGKEKKTLQQPEYSPTALKREAQQCTPQEVHAVPSQGHAVDLSPSMGLPGTLQTQVRTDLYPIPCQTSRYSLFCALIGTRLWTVKGKCWYEIFKRLLIMKQY